MNPESPTPGASGGAAKRDRVDEEVRRFLDDRLPGDDPNLAFVEAVILHLGAGPTAVLTQIEAAHEVVRVVISAYNGEVSRSLVQRPALLASIFQNADLLDPADPRSAALGRTVMRALEATEGQGS